MKIISEFKQFSILFCLFCFIISIDTKATEAVEGEYIVKYKDCDNASGFDEELKFPTMNATLKTINSRTKDSQSELASLQNDPCIEYVEPNYIFKLEAASVTRKKPNDPEFNKLWGLEKIQAKQAWDINTGNSNVIIAVIDTGVDYDHPDLKHNMWKNIGEIAGNDVDDDNNGFIDDIYGYDFANDKADFFDDHGHGSHVAGIIAASGDNEKGIAGVSWSAKIMALKITQSGRITTADAISAIEYAKLMGAKIINASWHIDAKDHPKALYDAIQIAKDAGILFVTAAGNESRNIDLEEDNPFACLQCPASYDLDNIISVAATNENDGLSPRSNFGKKSVDIAAPGTNIYSTTPQGKYAEKSGTSMAAPYVTGVASLLWSLKPNLTYREVKDIILSNVDPIDALKDKTVSGGRLNAYKALQNPSPTTTKKGPVAICKTSVNNSDVTFDASNSFGNIKIYNWIIYRKNNLDSNEEQEAAIINVKFPKDGSYTAKLIITDDKGLTDETKCSVKVPNNVQLPSTCITLGSNEVNSALKDETAIETSVPFTLNLDGPNFMNQCMSTSSTDSVEKIIKYIWTICKKNTYGDCQSLPDVGHQQQFYQQITESGRYLFRLTAESETGKKVHKEIKVNILPELGQGFGFDGDLSKPISTTASFAGGTSIGGNNYQQNMQKTISELAEVTAEIHVDPRHIGMKADILVVILDSETSKLFMLNRQGNLQDWNVKLSDITPFQYNIRLKKRQLVSMYKNDALISGNLSIFFGYRLFNRKVFAGGPIQIEVK